MRNPQDVHPAIKKMLEVQKRQKVDSHRLETPHKFVFVVPQHNQVELTYQCIKSLFTNLAVNKLNIFECRFKVVVFDNKSTEDISKLDELKEGNENTFDVIKLEDNYKWLNAFNYACKKYFDEEGADVIVYLNNDTLCSKNFLTNYIHAFQYYLDFGIIVPQYSDVLPQQHFSNSSYLDFDIEQSVKVEQISYSDGTCFALRKQLYNLIGGFDEKFVKTGGWGADYDYCIRAKNAGYRIGIARNIYIDHLKAQTSVAVGEDRGVFIGFYEILKEKYGKDYQTLLNKKL